MRILVLLLTLTVISTVTTGCSTVCGYLFPNDYSQNTEMDRNRVCAKITIPL